MTYDEFKKAWVWALRESMLPLLSGEPVDENVSLRAMDRVVKSFVGPFGGQHAAPFHISAALEYRWDALQTARAASTEEDMLHELLGLDRSRKPRTEKPWLRVDVTLRASTEWGKEIALPPTRSWKTWARETLGRLENMEPVIPIKKIQDGRHGMPEILAWQSEPELQATGSGPRLGVRRQVIPQISEPLTREEICKRYSYQWVCLVEIDKIEDQNFEFRTARVIGHGNTRREPLAQARPLRDHYPSIGHYFTGASPLPRLASLCEGHAIRSDAGLDRRRCAALGSSKRHVANARN